MHKIKSSLLIEIRRAIKLNKIKRELVSLYRVRDVPRRSREPWRRWHMLVVVVGLFFQRTAQRREPSASAITTTIIMVFLTAAAGEQPSTSGFGFGQRRLVSDSLHFGAYVDFDQRSIHNVKHFE